MKKKKLKIGLFAIVILIFLLVPFIGFQKDTQKPLRVGIVPWAGYGPIFIAKEKGFFDEEGVNVDIVMFEHQTIRSGFQADQVDSIIMPSESIMILYDSGVPIHIVMNMDFSNGGDGIIASEEIQSIADLKGKKIAFERGSPSHFLLSYLLNNEGLTTKDIEHIEASGYDSGSIFLSGDVDAAVTWEPWLSKVQDREGGHILYTTKGDPIINDLVIFNENAVKTRRDEIKKFMRAYFRALNYTLRNQDECYEIMARNFEVPLEDFMVMREGLKWPDYKENLEYFGTDDNPGPVNKILDEVGTTWIEEGFINKKPDDPNYIIDRNFLIELYD